MRRFLVLKDKLSYTFLRKGLTALQFLTIFPIKIKSEIKGKDFGASLLYFPLVGLLIGLLLSLSALSFSFLPSLVKGAIILILSIFITGGIHLDGFTDTCDGFYGNKPREKILEIMRDSRIGAMGLIGVVSILLLKFSLIVSFPEILLWKTLIVMSVFSRWSQGFACLEACYARQEGKAKYFIEYARPRDVFVGGIFTLGLFLLLMSLKGAILFFLSLIPVFLFLCYIKKKLGGMTGDTIGAVNEIAEVCVLLFGLILNGIPV
mgnify:FL=1